MFTRTRGMIIQASGNLHWKSVPEFRTPKLIHEAMAMPRKFAMKTREKLEPLS